MANCKHDDEYTKYGGTSSIYCNNNDDTMKMLPMGDDDTIATTVRLIDDKLDKW